MTRCAGSLGREQVVTSAPPRARPTGAWLLATALVATSLAAGTARADSSSPTPNTDAKQSCIAATEKGQQAKLEGKLRAAREQFLVCSRSECPALVRQDCAQWVTETIAALPTVVVGARDWQGHDVMAVKVSVDGVVTQELLDGKPFFVDPGAHTFRYESAGALPVEEKVLVREGEKNRTLTVQLPAAARGNVIPPDRGAPPPPPESGGGLSPLFYVFTSVGVVALGGALALDLWGNSEVNADARPVAQGGCKPNCDTNPITTKWYAAGVSLGVGVVALGVATYFLIARPSAHPDAKRARLWFELTPAPHGGLGQVVGRF